MEIDVKVLCFTKNNEVFETKLNVGTKRKSLGILFVGPDNIILDSKVTQVQLQTGPKDISTNTSIPFPEPGQVHSWTTPQGREIKIFRRAVPVLT